MEAKEQNRLRLKAEIMLYKANELIRFINMNETTSLVLGRHGGLMGFNQGQRMAHSINRRNVIIESLKRELSCII